jgi:hypothetical protein
VTALASGTVTGNEAADWAIVAVLPIGRPFNTAAPCVRGHIPDRLNGNLGGEFGRFVLSGERLLDRDPFWVSVTA